MITVLLIWKQMLFTPISLLEGVAYRCSFRVTEAVHAIERLTDSISNAEVGKDPAQLRMENFIKKEEFPWPSPTGWLNTIVVTTMPGLQKAMDALSTTTNCVRSRLAPARRKVKFMGIGFLPLLK